MDSGEKYIKSDATLSADKILLSSVAGVQILLGAVCGFEAENIAF